MPQLPALPLRPPRRLPAPAPIRTPLLPAPALRARQLPAPQIRTLLLPAARQLLQLPPALTRTPLLQAPQLLQAAPVLIRMLLLPAQRPRIRRPAARPELPLTRMLLLQTRIPLQPIRLQRLTKMQVRTTQMQDRNCPRPLLRCRYSACWDSALWLPAS